jgi:O-antigen/teichoic acid export membrane protein
VFILAYLFIDKLVDLKYVKVALHVLPLSLFCLFINSLGGVFTSALEGFQRNYIKNFVYSSTSICYLILTILLIPKFGLFGLAVAQVVQSIMIFMISYYFLTRKCRTFSIFQWNWDRKLFKKLFNYGYKIQVISICQMLIDPITKILISKFNGLSTLGFYEMASRLIIQLRQIIVNMNQVTIPIVSHYSQTDKSAINYIYERGLSFIIFIVFPLFAGIILFTPYLSGIWIGHVEPVFINCVYILALSMLINILCTPAYFNSFGEGNLNGVLYMNILIVLLNAILGVALGKTIPIYGVAVGWGISAAIGSVFLIYYYQKRNNIRFRNLLATSDYIIIIGAIIFSILSRFVFLNIGKNVNFNIKSLVYFFIAYFAFFIPVAYFNRNFKLLNIFQYFKK